MKDGEIKKGLKKGEDFCEEKHGEKRHHEHDGCKGAHCDHDHGCECCDHGEENVKAQIIILAVSAVALVAGYLISHFSGVNNVLKWLNYFNPSYIAVILCGYPLFKEAAEGIWEKKIKTELLITFAMLSCMVLEILTLTGVVVSSDGHYLFTAGEIAFLMMLGEMLEDYTVGKSRAGIESIAKLMPETCNVKVGDEWVEKPVEEVKVGDEVLVKPSEKIPVDGTVTVGSTSVDQSGITGESVLVEKNVGDEVFCGTTNGDGLVQILVTKASEDSTMSKLVKMVEEASAEKSPTARIADKMATFIVPSAITLSVAIFFVVFFGMKLEWYVALIRAITILVVFCPCSLVLATPTAIAAGIGNAAKKGVMVRTGEALEKIGKSEVVAFDKTGTVTKGVIKVSEYFTLDDNFDKRVIYDLESATSHPIARALTEYIGCGGSNVSDVTQIKGVGVKGDIDGKEIVVSNLKYAIENFSVPEEIKDFCQRSAGKNIAVCSVDKNAVCVFAFSDEIRPEAADSISKLNQMGLETVMLTGDNFRAADAVAKEVGIKDFKAECMPEDKVERIKELSESKKVCFVGDGVNDAPSLAISHSSIAMGELGSEIAVESADITILNSDLNRIPRLIKFSKRVLSVIKFNILIGMVINLVAVVCSLFGVLTPMWGAVIHNLSSVVVVLHSITLLFADKDKKN